MCFEFFRARDLLNVVEFYFIFWNEFSQSSEMIINEKVM